MSAYSQWLTVHAGGRREVLRRLVPDLLGKHIEIREFYFRWDGDQPSLRLYLSSENSRRQAAHQLINTIENALDAIMALYPWEEQPLLDWTEAPGPTKLSVMLEPALDVPQNSGALPFEVTRQIHQLLEHDGAVIKTVLVHTLHLIFKMYSELRIDCQTLFECIPEGIRGRIFAKLAWLKTNFTRPCEEPLLWGVIRDAMPRMEMASRQELLKNVVDCLGFRPDEKAYLFLLANTIKYESSEGSR